MNHGDTACTARVKSAYHGEHGGHGEKQNKERNLSLSFSVSSVVNAFVFAFRRARRVAVVKIL
jgi:hypothetical protein